MNPAKSKQGVSLVFQPNYSSKYELFEVDQQLLDELMKRETKMTIKCFEEKNQKSAALCTKNSTFKLKKHVTSN